MILWKYKSVNCSNLYFYLYISSFVYLCISLYLYINLYTFISKSLFVYNSICISLYLYIPFNNHSTTPLYVIFEVKIWKISIDIREHMALLSYQISKTLCSGKSIGEVTPPPPFFLWHFLDKTMIEFQLLEVSVCILSEINCISFICESWR